MHVDRQWFKNNRDRNFRIRKGAPGEVEKIFRRSVNAAGYEIAAGGGLPDVIGDDMEWRVAVINAGQDTLIFMPVIRPKGAPDELGPEGVGGTGISLVWGNRLVMEKIGG